MAMGLKLRTKLLGGSVIVAVFTLGVGLIGWTASTRLARGVNDLGGKHLPKIENLCGLLENMETIRVAQRTLLSQSRMALP